MSVDLVRHLPMGDVHPLRAHEARSIARLLGIAEVMGLSVEWSDLGTVRRGSYSDADSLIRLNNRCTSLQMVSTLGHELAHAMFRDVGPTSDEVEERAHRVGAALAVDPVAFRQQRSLVRSVGELRARDVGITKRALTSLVWTG